MKKPSFEHQIPQRLLHLRTISNRTTQELADVCKVRRVTYEGYEQGRTCPSLVKLVALCNFYGVSIEYILGIKDFDTLLYFD